MHEMKVRKVDSMSVAKFGGTLGALWGLLVAILRTISYSVSFGQANDTVLGALAFGLTIGIFAIVVVPLIYFAIGWVIGLFYGWLYNIVAGNSGGISLKVE